ncbi:MAG TPA: elongation factor G [Acidobacteriaceae bacterium]|jgi:elongation factor G|nr:elongation factor G [Acidobacteriaceae bacterium]
MNTPACRDNGSTQRHHDAKEIRMKVYAGSELRNIALVGHAQSGKTALISAILKTARMADDAAAYDEEELARRMTMANSTAFAEWSGIKINLIDTPGFHMFLHEARSAMLPAETAAVVINSQTGIESGTDKVWNFATEVGLPRIIVINQLDHPKAHSADRATELVEALRARWGRQVVPIQLPIIDEQGFHGVIDLVTMEAFSYSASGDGRGTAGPIPQPFESDAKAAHEALIELVAEGKDELMEEFFAVGTIPQEHLVSALHEAIREDRIFPVVYASGLRNIGTDHLLDFVKTYAPSSAERPAIATRGLTRRSGNGSGADSQEMVMRSARDTEPTTLYVYKTLVDPFAGRISFFKIISGSLKNDAALENYSRGESERLSHLAIAQGRKLIEVGELHAGDLGAVAKLRVTQSGDTLGVKGQEVLIEPVPVAEPAMTYAIEPKSRADEDKLAPALHKLMEEDLLLRFYRDPQTSEFLLAGAGQLHIETVVSKLRRRFHTEVTLKSPKVPYRETIRAHATGHGRHKKQTGGHGQFADCKIRVEPLPRGSGFEFLNDIFGGAIPRQYVPAVEKGIQECAVRGYLAGYPVVDFRATVFDGSYHDVDSSELAFKLAGRLAFRACMEQAKPALLEPVMRVEIEAPDEFAGAIMGDLNSRRGRVQGMESAGSGTVVHAEVPLSEMLTYGTTLTSMTQGRASFRMEMDHYDFVPTAIAEKIAAGAKRPAGEDLEE